MFNKTQTNFWLDGIIFSLFALTALTGLLLWLVIPDGPGSGQSALLLGLVRRTWVSLHNWLGLAMLAGTLLHLVLHWDWIMCVAGRFFKQLAGPARLNFSLDSLLFVAFFLSSLSGLIVWLVLPAGGHRGGRNPLAHAALLGLTRHDWSDLHLWAGLAVITILLIHLALHWNWLVCMTRRYAWPASSRPAKGAEV